MNKACRKPGSEIFFIEEFFESELRVESEALRVKNRKDEKR